MTDIRIVYLSVLLSILLCISCKQSAGLTLEIHDRNHIALVGNNLCSRMINFGHFETELYMRYGDSSLVIRNLCDGGNTPGFNPHSAKDHPWAWEGADQYQTDLAVDSRSIGYFPSPDDWLTLVEADVIVGFFGFNEAQYGEAGLERFKGELSAWVDHVHEQQYNGASAPKVAIVSPTAYQDITDVYDVPDGKKENLLLLRYTEAMKKVAQDKGLVFVDAFAWSKKMYRKGKRLTSDGLQLTDEGYQEFSTFLVDEIFGESPGHSGQHRSLVRGAVMEKNWMWHNDYKMPNGVHVYGRRFEPFGPDNYPAEIEKIRQMTEIRDRAIWAATSGLLLNVMTEDLQTATLPPVETNYTKDKEEYLYGDDALSRIYTAPGYHLELFASEKDFPDLANPVQLSFDNAGRLWVATMPSYPHYRPGDDKPNDKLIILEDTDGDGKADKQSTYADGLHLPIGFEFAPEGVYISQGTNLKLLKDTDGDGRADQEEIIYSGFDDHDTHHAISAFCADPSGAIYMAEGVFLHTNVETPYGTVRGTHGGFYRFNPTRRHLERTAQLSIPNPWGIAFDEWGQNIFAETSGPSVRWMMPGSVAPRYGHFTPKGLDLIEEEHMVRPTSGLEFVYSSHFPDEVQGDFLINNAIGYLGTKQHYLVDSATGYNGRYRQDLLWSDDKNFRPVDMEFAPDGSLYIVDWHNILIGHMQHNARDPLRDHVHGRIYRLTYPSRPLVTPPAIVGASIETLLNNLKLAEYRARYRTRRELRGRDQENVLTELAKWVGLLDHSDPRYEHHRLEALWVTWGLNVVDQKLLTELLNSQDYRVRAAAVHVVRYMGHQLPDQADLLLHAAGDEHGRVRLEALVAASWLHHKVALPIIEKVAEQAMDDWMLGAYEAAMAVITGTDVEEEAKEEIKTHLVGGDIDHYKRGKAIYERDGYCGTCHQANGKGLQASGFPPLAGTKWANGSEERLIKLSLKGLHGPIEVLGKNIQDKFL